MMIPIPYPGLKEVEPHRSPTEFLFMQYIHCICLTVISLFNRTHLLYILVGLEAVRNLVLYDVLTMVGY